MTDYKTGVRAAVATTTRELQRVEYLAKVVGRMGGKWEEETALLVVRELAAVSDGEFESCCRQAEMEVRYPPRPADFLERCPSLRWQTADEAWATLSGINDHSATTVLTDLSRAAWHEVRNCYGEEAQRRAFLGAYNRLASEWKALSKRPQWVVSEGNDPARKRDAIKAAIQQGKLRAADYRALLAPPPEPARQLPQPMARVQPTELTPDDIRLLELIQKSDSTTVQRDAVAQLGSNAVGKLIAYATRNAPYTPPQVHAVVMASADDCYESCGRKAVANSSRCERCGPAARERARVRADKQSAGLARGV